MKSRRVVKPEPSKVEVRPKKQHDPIRTAGALRNFLADLMVDIRNGETDTETARNIAKIADQINNSFFAEARLATVAMAAGTSPPEFGQQQLNSESVAVHVRRIEPAHQTKEH